MISNFNTGSVVVKIFSRSVMISEVCGCSSPVLQSGDYNPNWSHLIVISQTFRGHLLPPTGRAVIVQVKIRSTYIINVCAIRFVILDNTKKIGPDFFHWKCSLLFKLLFSTTSYMSLKSFFKLHNVSQFIIWSLIKCYLRSGILGKTRNRPIFSSGRELLFEENLFSTTS